MIFLSPFLDIIKMSNVNCFFHGTARHWNSLLPECFPLTFDLNDFKPRVNRHFELCLFPFSNHLFYMFFIAGEGEREVGVLTLYLMLC